MVLVLSATVGFSFDPHTTPYWVGLGEPRDVILPLPVAVVAVMPVTACVVTAGGDVYVNRSFALNTLVPPAVVTVMSTVPVPAGDTANIELSDKNVTLAALVIPNLTVESLVKLVPVKITAVPPDADPLVGAIVVTVGAATVILPAPILMSSG